MAYDMRMFSDTHFHLDHIADTAAACAGLFDALAARDTFFALDIGTHCDDLSKRLELASSGFSALAKPEIREKVSRLLHFSAGIWPAAEAIAARFEQLALLRLQIAAAANAGVQLAAIGECGIDRHWNRADREKAALTGEQELFSLQLELARGLGLPVVVHSRDAFAETFDCIRNTGYDRGVIHCFSYGVAEARAFLDRGWYISFSGSVTYAKKKDRESTRALLRFVPCDRLLVETDAPYLAPVPHRGEVNTPLFIEHTYEYIAHLLDMPAEELSVIVDRNIQACFITQADLADSAAPVPTRQ